MGDYRADVRDRVAYHIFCIDLRTETVGLSVYEAGMAEYLAYHNNENVPLGTTVAVPQSAVVYKNSFYCYQGDERNFSTDEYFTNPETGLSEELYKMNTRLGQYTIEQTLPLFASIPVKFGLEVSAYSQILITGAVRVAHQHPTVC